MNMMQWSIGLRASSSICFSQLLALVASTSDTQYAAEYPYDTYPGGPWNLPPPNTRNATCVVEPAPNGGDSAPAIITAFEQCGHNGRIVFQNTTYNVNSVMNTTGLENCEIEVRGTLLWSTDVDYWLNHSLPVGYQNQSSSWFFGGHNIHLYGNGYGTLDGNGQTWYDFVGHASNYPRRPHAITFSETTNSIIEGIRFVQSQMWTMTIIHSENILLQDIYINNTNIKGGPHQNTDGCDTIYANNITFNRWIVDNGDDSISQKANSTNILIQNSTFYNGGGIAMGSIGQYNGRYEIIENVTARDIICHHTFTAGYAKTWTGIVQNYPPNGGGGGLGYMKNIVFTNFTVFNASKLFSITQCTSYSGARGACDTSNFQIEDLTWGDVQGTIRSEIVASLQCSGSVPCTGVNISGINVTLAGNESAAAAVPMGYLCSNVSEPIGFTCTGLTAQV